MSSGSGGIEGSGGWGNDDEKELWFERERGEKLVSILYVALAERVFAIISAQNQRRRKEVNLTKESDSRKAFEHGPRAGNIGRKKGITKNNYSVLKFSSGKRNNCRIPKEKGRRRRGTQFLQADDECGIIRMRIV